MKNFPVLILLFLAGLIKAQCTWTVGVTAANQLNCNNSTVLLSGSHNCTNNVSYSWVGPGIVGSNSSQNITVNSPGVYSLTVTDVLTSCFVSGTYTMQTNFTTPLFSVSPGSYTITCANSTPQFTATAINPTTCTFTWYMSTNSQIVLTQTGGQSVYSPIATGNHTVVATNTVSGCVSSTVINVGMNATLPSYSVQSNNGYLIGCDPVTTVSITNLVLSAPGATGSFTFIPPGGAYTFPFNFTSSNTPSVVTLSAIGSYSLIVQDDSNGCQAQTLISIAPASTSLSLTYTVNASGNVNFASTSTGTNTSTTYQWIYGDGTNGYGATSNHPYANGGIHNVVLQTTNPSCTSAPVPVNVNSIPCNAISSFSLFPSGTPQLWHASPDYFGNVINAVWNWGDGYFTNALYPSHTYSAAGLYNICLSVTVSCANTSSTCSSYNIYRSLEVQTSMVTVNVIPNSSIATGLNQTGTPISLKIFPNPANDFLIIDTERNDVVISNIFIIDMTGRSVFSEPVFDKRLQLINTSNLQTGVYIIELHTEHQILRKKISISK